MLLTELNISHCSSKANSVIKLLRALPNLEKLSLTDYKWPAALNKILHSLSKPRQGRSVPFEEEREQDAKRDAKRKQFYYCPRLNYLNLTSSFEFVCMGSR